MCHTWVPAWDQLGPRGGPTGAARAGPASDPASLPASAPSAVLVGALALGAGVAGRSNVSSKGAVITLTDGRAVGAAGAAEAEGVAPASLGTAFPVGMHAGTDAR